MWTGGLPGLQRPDGLVPTLVLLLAVLVVPLPVLLTSSAATGEPPGGVTVTSPLSKLVVARSTSSL